MKSPSIYPPKRWFNSQFGVKRVVFFALVSDIMKTLKDIGGIVMVDFWQKTAAMCMGTAGISGYDQKRGYDYVWFGSLDGADKEPIIWRVLSIAGNGGTYRDDSGAAANGVLFLLSDDILGTHPLSGEIRVGYTIKFDETNQAWDFSKMASIWQNSDARRWCAHFA